MEKNALTTSSPQEMSFENMTKLIVGVLRDYARQTDEVLQSLQEEGEVESNLEMNGVLPRREQVPKEYWWVHERIRRLKCVMKILQNAKKQQERLKENAPSTGTALAPSSLPLVMQLMKIGHAGLRRTLSDFTGSNFPPRSSGDPEPTAATAAERLPRCQPLARPWSIAAAALLVSQANTQLALRRGGATSSALAASTVAEHDDSGASRLVWEEPPMTTVLRAAQRKDRLQLYTGRVALLPQVDRFAEWLSSVAQQGEESKKEEASPFHSPARTLLARLSTCAEGKLMQRFWVVSVKGQWLLDGKAVKSSWGTLYETVKQRYADRFSAEITQAPHNDGFVLNEGGVKRRRCEAIREDAEKGLPLWWLNTLETDAGVVRLQLHRGLVIDLTYHPWEREWLLLGLHWTLLTHTSPTLIEEGSAWWVSDEEEEEGEAEENEEEESSAHFLYVVPGHQAEMRQHLQRKFAEDGLEGGCLAANQLSLCLLMDTIAQQLHQLKEHVFVGRLKGKWETEIVRGSFISFRFQPHASLFAAVRARSSGGFSGEVLHGKFFIEGGTLLFEHHWGTDLITQRIYPLLQISPSVVLSAQDEGADGATQLQTVGDAKLTGPRGAAEGVVLDADQLVWYCCQQSLL